MFDTSFIVGFICDGVSNLSPGSVYPKTFLEFGINKKKHFSSVMATPLFLLLECSFEIQQLCLSTNMNMLLWITQGAGEMLKYNQGEFR